MNSRAVIHDQDLIRSAFPEWDTLHRTMTSPDVLNVVIDIVFDWLSITVAILILLRVGWWTAPAAVAWIGNRQRALGNLLHDAAHRNFARSSRLNDALARLFIAPALFNGLALYRELHARHHAWLGDPTHDPDYIAVQPGPGDGWWQPFLKVLLAPAAWSASIFGHLHLRRLGWMQRLGIIGWWVAVLGAVTLVRGVHAAALFFGIWMLARATFFHAITTFRELCDHFGLARGGIFSYTRDVSSRSVMRWIIHPHNNGYHLMHHLMPSIPYHRLPRAQRRLLALPAFASEARVCHAYFRGPEAVVREWEVQGGENAAA
ncbi:fatty acid desaturase [Paraburkholderia sp. BL23I1N1]|uniref:fatty acid desaturase n=1 Tax=unclassified Paraburkholderia TaxID=2615204 RepID=UPI000E24D409|nr:MULTISPECIES: fatty acid desaturase [unclassified Paraburkholderia]REE18588.1 fatty acid desaturase [Paraburkholderia sp. BL27I4N3]RKE35602.1 fatty acid desaturase [Paraburkholderia sp. BL23I1N1]